MIRIFEDTVRRHGDAEFMRFADGGADGQATRMPDVSITYAQARLASIALMHQIAREGSTQGDYLAADMDNCPAFVYLLLACWYGGFRLIALNHRLTDDEKDERLAQVEETTGIAPVLLTEADILEMVDLGREAATDHELIHSAQRAAALSESADQAVLMFTSGTTGTPKAAVLSGRALMSSAYTFNGLFGGEGTLWQACLPLYHIGGLQVVIRSILNGTPFILYRRFEAPRVLADAQRFNATHVSVVDKTLRDLLEWAGKGVHGGEATLRAYRCILLGGAAPNAKTIAAAQQVGAPVYSSYGMTETCSLVAACSITEEDGRLLHVLPGYEACVVDSDDYGRGQLGIKGPGLFEGYLGQKLALTADGFFLTGDTALVQDGCITIGERTADMFISGGENIYPEEIRRKLLEIPGVTDAYVYGVSDETWGRRPVAFVEMADTRVTSSTAVALSRQVMSEARDRLARIYQPDRLFVLPVFPRHGVGKINRRELERRAECCLDVRRVELRHISQPFVQPIRTAKGQLDVRESLVVQVFDAQGRCGIGEDVAFSTDWYLPETIDADLAFLRDYAIPHVLEDVYLRPEEVYGSLATCPGAEGHRMAVAMLETALWDLFGSISEKPLRSLLGAADRWMPPADGVAAGVPASPAGMAPGGAVIGLMPVDQAVEAARQAVAQGYRRIKLKISRGDDVERVRAVKQAVPEALLMLDANQCYTELDMSTLRQLDALGCAGIEEPLDPNYEPKAKISLFDRLSDLQRLLKTTVYLDESIVTDDDMRAALSTPGIRGYVLKAGKLGGILPTLQFFQAARARGAQVWMGGMFDTGVSKRLHAALGLMNGVALPGDISDTSRYFATDITTPPLELANGNLLLNPPECPYGIGCSLDEETLAQVTVESWEFK